jgi:hypothetical protein
MLDLIETLEESIQGKSLCSDQFGKAAEVILEAKERTEKGTPAYEALSIAFMWVCGKQKELLLKEVGV